MNSSCHYLQRLAFFEYPSLVFPNYPSLHKKRRPSTDRWREWTKRHACHFQLVLSNGGFSTRMSERGESSSSSPSTEESAPFSSSSSPHVQEEVEEGERDQIEQHPFPHHEVERQHIDTTHRENFTTFSDTTSVIHDDDSWSCIIVVLTFWFFVSMTLVLGVYGSVNLRLGPNSSILVQPNALFVQSLKVEQLDDTKPGPLLYGFYKPPALDVVTSWSKTYNASVAADYHMEWTYYLNQGSQINISYSVNTPESSIFLVIAEGSEDFTQWLENPTYPNTTLSWNVIHGAGTIQQDIYQSADYYVAVGNLNTEEVEVQLSITATAYLYNTTDSYYKCTFSSGECSLDILFPFGNAAILATPNPGQGTPSDEWYIRISYGPRWIAYILGIGGMSSLMLAAFHYLNMFRWTREERNRGRHEQLGSERAPLLSQKEDDSSSLCSSYDSNSQDEKDIEEFLSLEGIERKQKDGENGNNTRRLCAICFDAPRDCFFLPCGHCVSCFDCGTRIMEASGTCPMCRRSMKKVRKIFTV